MWTMYAWDVLLLLAADPSTRMTGERDVPMTCMERQWYEQGAIGVMHEADDHPFACCIHPASCIVLLCSRCLHVNNPSTGMLARSLERMLEARRKAQFVEGSFPSGLTVARAMQDYVLSTCRGLPSMNVLALVAPPSSRQGCHLPA